MAQGNCHNSCWCLPAARRPLAQERAASIRRPTSPPFMPFRPNTAWWWRRRNSPRKSAPIFSRQGGNAVDAAVATGFALAVTYPRAGNIGGGGFMVIHSAERNEDVAIDYRETAPAATTRDIFLGADGKPDADKSRNSALGIGVPGTVAGLALALEKYGSGRFTLAQILKPAIELARDGFVVTDDTADTLPDMYRRMARWPNSAKGVFPRRRHTVAGRRPADPARSRGDAVGDRRAGTARLLRRAGRREAGKGRQRRRRHHDGGRSEILSGRDPRRRCAAAIAATTSSRCRCPRPAAPCCWRR